MSVDMADLSLEVVRTSAVAVFVSDGDIDVWLPKSHIVYDEELEAGRCIEFKVPEWLAEREGLI